MKLTPKIQKAINAAAVLHYEQKRKSDGKPYVLHPYSVAFILADYTDDEDIIVAGLLHDVLEDVEGYSFDDMKKDFCERIAQIVEGVSEEKNPNGNSDKRESWNIRKKGYIEKLKEDGFESMMVCAADKIHNLNSIMGAYKERGEKTFEKFNAPIEKRMWFYGEVFKILKERLDNKIIDELERVYSKAEKLFKSK